MSSEELDDRVSNWVETSGRALELRVARTVSAMAGDAVRVERSYHYRDPRTQIVREGDVRATFTWENSLRADCTLTVIVECKSGKDKPWVGFLTDNVRNLSLRRWLLGMDEPLEGSVTNLQKLWIRRPPFDDPRMCLNVVTALADDRKNSAYDAVRQALSAAEGRWHTRITGLHNSAEPELIVAAVVTEAPLYTCWLNLDGAVEVKRVDQLVVQVNRPDGNHLKIRVMNEDALPPFISNLRERAEAAHENC